MFTGGLISPGGGAALGNTIKLLFLLLLAAYFAKRTLIKKQNFKNLKQTFEVGNKGYPA